MQSNPVATNDSVNLEFGNESGRYLARLDVRPRSRPDGALVVNTQLELSVRSRSGEGIESWAELTVAGAVFAFSRRDEDCAGGVGVSLADRSARIDVTWRGERLGESGVVLTAVTVSLSKLEPTPDRSSSR